MDPNTTLAALRHAANALPTMIDDVKTEEDAGLALGAAMTLASHFWALDQWLQKGGFPPDAWNPGVGVIDPDYVLDRIVPDPLGPPDPAGAHLPEHDHG